MSMSQPPVDQAVRERALDPRHSFIVQAPAGSGKTGLLTQRYLRLLSCVERPESIIAITFTRKAAGEMRERILSALQQARDLPEPDADYAKVTWQLARTALQQDQAQAWSLLDNPGRLQIQTFDSFCGKLAAQMPLLSSFGATPAVLEDARKLYLQAAEATLGQLENQSDSSQHIAALLRHLDNRLDNLRELLADMLARRDQWLRHVADPNDPRLERDNIELALQHLVEEALLRLAHSIPADRVDELLSLLRFAANNCADDSAIAACRDIEDIPEADVNALRQWQGIAELLQTLKGDWRKSVTLKQGFPPSSSSKNKEEKARLAEMKERMLALLQAFDEHENFRTALADLKNLPATHYSDSEWEILNALFALLPYSVAHLRLVFQERGEVDFTEISLRAIQALGQGDDPTDLALKLDYQIQHLLVDEFQDTSINQYELIKNLIAGWEEEDARSLFLVGDPMQSIYRFREAEVGLFLETCESGLAQKKLEFLQLQVNFRSCKNIIEWANKNFPHILPQRDDPVSGAVSYAPSVAAKAAISEPAVEVHAAIGRDDMLEAEEIIAIIRAAQTDSIEQRIAILVRNRSHLLQIIKRLRDESIRFQAVDIDALINRPVVQDLLALTRALLHPADRISWLSVLRAPFCGLTLLDLHRLCAEDKLQTLPDLLHDESRRASLSEDGQKRLRRAQPILEQAVQNRARRNLRSWVEAAWLALGGPACLLNDSDLADAEEFFLLLEELDNSDEVEAVSELQARVETLYAKPDSHSDSGADSCLQLMTIHKAKGLEFDTVIIPGLGKSPKGDSSRLLYWLEQPGIHGDTDLLFGPVKSARGERNKTAEYIQALETEKKHIENARLLYVAVTRAKQRLHLFAHAEPGSDMRLRQPGKNTLLASLWPAVKNQFEKQHEKRSAQHAVAADEQAEAVNHEPACAPRSRLVANWQCPPPPPGIQLEPQIEAGEENPQPELEFDWAGDTARHVGVVVHRLLEQIAGTGVEKYRQPKQTEFSLLVESMLLQAGLAREVLAQAVKVVVSAINNMLADERGRWILSAEHEQAACELALTSRIEGELRRLVIDRTFVDKEGTRWIIDYKTGVHAGGGLEAFLDSEQERYRYQLQRYAAVLQKMESRKIRMALYFPVLRAWREWGL